MSGDERVRVEFIEMLGFIIFFIVYLRGGETIFILDNFFKEN